MVSSLYVLSALVSYIYRFDILHLFFHIHQNVPRSVTRDSETGEPALVVDGTLDDSQSTIHLLRKLLDLSPGASQMYIFSQLGV